MMVRAHDGFDVDDRKGEPAERGAAAKAAYLAGWMIVAALLLTLVAAS
jgi:hypothetical protein